MKPWLSVKIDNLHSCRRWSRSLLDCRGPVVDKLLLFMRLSTLLTNELDLCRPLLGSI